MMGREKNEEVGMGGGFEGGTPAVAATPPPADEQVANPGATPDSSRSEATAKTSGELQQARDKSWARGEVPGEILENSKGGSPADTVHHVNLRHPHDGYSDNEGFVPATLNLKVLKETRPDLYKETVDHKLVSITEGGVEYVDIRYEFGGEDEFGKFMAAEGEKTDGVFQKPDINEHAGYVRKENVTAEKIAQAYELWLAENVQKTMQTKLDALKAAPLPEPQPLPLPTDVSATAAGSEVVDPAVQQAQQREQAEAERQQEIDKLQTQLEQAKKNADAARQKVEETKRKDNLKKKENTPITDEKARELIEAIETFKKQENAALEKFKQATTNEEKQKAQEELSLIRRQKAEVMLTAIGYDAQEATIILSGNADTNLALFLRLAKHTSLSKEQNSPNIAELNRVVKTELLQTIADLLNKDKPEREKQTFEQVRVMKAGEALRAAMKALGFDVETQNKKVKELFESANSSERKLNTSEDDPLHTMIEALVSGKPTAEMEKDAKSWFKKMEEEFRETGEKIEDFPKWLERKINEVFHGTYNPEFAESIGLFFTMLLAEYLDVGAFMEMLLVGGDHFSSLAHDLGFKSKEQLLKEGKHPIDEHDIDSFIRKDNARATNARGLLCAGLEDIIPKDVIEQYLHNPSPSAVLKDEGFFKLLEKAFSKEYYKKFCQNLLKALGYTEKAQESDHIELTNTAITFIMSLPELAKKGNWTDGGEIGGEKGAEEKDGEAAGGSTEKPVTQSSGADQAEQSQASQPATPAPSETNTS